MNTRTKWALGVGAAVAALALAAALGTRGTAVRAVAVTRGAITQSVVATGRIEAPARIDVAAEVTATVRAVRVREGDRVRAGQPLVELVDDEARAALAQARAQQAEALQRQHEQASVTAPVSDQALEQARANLINAEREAERVRTLVAQGFYPPQRLDEAERVLANARSALATARVQAEANRAGAVGPALVRTRVEQAHAAVALAQARLERLTLRAPMDAVVLSRTVEPGALAQPGRVLLSLAADGPPRIEAAIDEKNLRLLTPGMAARAVADAYPHQPFDAVLDWVGPAVDAQRGTVAVRLRVPQPPAFVRPDMTVSVELLGGRREGALLLPATAVRDADRDAPWVLAVREGRAVRVPVTLGLRGVGVVEVADGPLREGERVIPQTEKAAEGERVRVLPDAAVRRGLEVPAGALGR